MHSLSAMYSTSLNVASISKWFHPFNKRKPFHLLLPPALNSTNEDCVNHSEKSTITHNPESLIPQSIFPRFTNNIFNNPPINFHNQSTQQMESSSTILRLFLRIDIAIRLHVLQKLTPPRSTVVETLTITIHRQQLTPSHYDKANPPYKHHFSTSKKYVR
ncbi:hypothetical protein L2E82_45456 [Cichorium intybus]|uniref:Uncharacterized protein n=1 Tax=Cichorium intybus TaxID=13427 RepID=A0ACB8ZUD5_CICIN|nr:hypothetical protein L2E82_45456 [Cichorium intybus]